MPLTRRTEGIYTEEAPQTFLGLHVGTRMAVVKLADGSLLVHSPIALDGLRAEIDALGEVAHVVCPNVYHHLYAGDWAKAYPKALVHAPRALEKKRPDLRIDRVLDESSWGDEITTLHVDGCMLDETVLVHRPSRTLISADLLENFTDSDHLPTRLYLKAGGIWKKPGWNRFMRFVYRDKRAARKSVDQLLEQDFDRVLIAHGDVIESGGKDAIRTTFTFL
jgi:hypothetical protein